MVAQPNGFTSNWLTSNWYPILFCFRTCRLVGSSELWVLESLWNYAASFLAVKFRDRSRRVRSGRGFNCDCLSKDEVSLLILRPIGSTGGFRTVVRCIDWRTFLAKRLGQIVLGAARSRKRVEFQLCIATNGDRYAIHMKRVPSTRGSWVSFISSAYQKLGAPSAFCRSNMDWRKVPCCQNRNTI